MHSKYVSLLDSVYLEYAQMVEDANKNLEVQSFEQRRSLYLESALPLQTNNGIDTTDSLVHARDGYSIPVRTFKNTFSRSSNALTIYLHGGGWVLGNLDTHHDICCDICNNTNSNVLAIDYRLAPENPFPTPLYDCIDAIKASLGTEGPTQMPEINSLVLSGDSAGANLSAASILSGEVKLPMLVGQVLIYAGLGASLEAESFKEHIEAPILSTALLETFFRNYLNNDESIISELTSPLLAEDLSAMPKTYISAAANDPLRDDSIAFFEKLKTQGVSATLQIEEKLGHGYLRVRNQSESAIRAFNSVCSAIINMHDSVRSN